MSQPTPLYVDGYVTPERQVTLIPDVEFPFENNSPPDTYARILSRRYDVTPKFFTPKIGVRTSWTNYLLYTETFANAAWTKTNITNTDSQLANPNDGAVTMASGVETVTNAEHAYQQAYTFTAVAHTLSWIVQPNGRTWYRLKANDGTTNFTAFFNLTGAGVTGTLANCTAAVVLLSAGVYRISITFTPLAAAGNIYLNYSTDGSTVSYAGSTSLGAYVWGAQIVRASTAGPVIITTSVARAVSSPNLDESDPFAYLAYEDQPRNYNSAVAGIARRFARIPTTQYLYEGSQYISLPQLANVPGGLNNVAVYSPFSNVLNQLGVAFPLAYSIFYLDSAGAGVYNQYAYGGPGFFTKKTVSGVTVGYATAGTFTLTYKTDTTAGIAYNATSATIQGTLNALASVVADGITFTCTGGTGTPLTDTNGANFTLTRGVENATVAPVSMNSSGLTTTTVTTNYHTLLDGFTDSFLLTDTFASTAHGFSASNRLLYGAENFLQYRLAAPGSWAVIDANTLGVPTSGQSLQYTFACSNASGYTGGTALIRTRTKRDHYLPGVTTGISSVSDITPTTGLQQNNIALWNLVGANAGFQAYQSNGPRAWTDAPQIYVVDTLQINADDFLLPT
jgi:hypothetical protein